MKIVFYPEECCDWCNDTIHTHMHCPVCEDEYAGTDVYGDVTAKDIVGCEECGAKFRCSGGDGWNPDKWEWERVK